jgi:hypothetical protein
MTTVEWNTLFDLIADKAASAYFTVAEKEMFFNRAQVIFVNSFFKPKSDSVFEAEATSVDLEAIRPLIFELGKSTKIPTDVNGKILFTTLNTALGSNKEVMYVLNASRSNEAITTDACGTQTSTDNFKRSHFVRHNDILIFEENSFKKSEEDKPNHRYFSTYIKFDPEGIRNIAFTVVRYPTAVGITVPANSELPDKTHNEIILIALKLAGIAIREQELVAYIDKARSEAA